jgi:hypothetical protein
MMGGDTNVVEDALDRLPARPDPVSALDELKLYLQLVDGWRETFPTTRAYTYHQSYTGSQSRIDRIYVKRDIFDQTFEWEISMVGIQTDHRMVSVKLTTEKSPTLGHGRWAWPAHLIKDKTLANFILQKGLELQANLEVTTGWEIRSGTYNAQTLWKEFKDEIGAKARERARKVVPKITKEIAELEVQLKLILADDALSDEELKLSGTVLVEKLAELHRKKFKDQ